jgi:hypothetical protein
VERPSKLEAQGDLPVTATVVLPLAAGAVSATGLVAQMRRVRAGSVAGVSVLTWALIAVVNIAGALHLTGTGHLLPAGVNALSAVATAAIAGTAWHRARAQGRPTNWPAGRRRQSLLAGVVLLWTISVVTPELGRWAGALAAMVMFLPQVRTVLGAAWRRQELGGVSAVAWSANLVISLLWLGWAISAGHLSTMASNTAVALSTSTVVGVLVIRKVRHLLRTRRNPEHALTAGAPTPGSVAAAG